MREFSRTGVLVGYSTVALLTLAPLAVLAAIDAPVEDIGTPPFVVFAAVIAVVLIVLRPIWLVATLHPEPTRQLLDDLRQHWVWLLACGFLMLAIVQTLEGAAGIKQAIPQTNPFWADAALIELDRILLLGADAWQITHAALPSSATRIIEIFYMFWHMVQLAFCILMIVLFDKRLQLQTVISFQLAWLILGNLLATAFSSVGPIFVADFVGRDDFAPLAERLQGGGATATLTTYEYLIAGQGTNAVGAGISAMPSLHVGIAVLVALFVRQRFPRFQWVAWAFAGITYIGSIHLGWHYATDGIVSGAGVALIWKGSGAYVEWLANLRGSEARAALANS